MEYSKQIANTLISHMEEQEYKYEFERENGMIRLKFKIKGKLDGVQIILSIKEQYYTSYGCINIKVDEDQRKEVSEFLTRANYGLIFGNFEMDMEDGEVRFKYTVDCEDHTPSSEMIESSLNIPIVMFQRYGNELLKVIFGMASAAEAVRIAESEE